MGKTSAALKQLHHHSLWHTMWTDQVETFLTLNAKNSSPWNAHSCWHYYLSMDRSPDSLLINGTKRGPITSSLAVDRGNSSSKSFEAAHEWLRKGRRLRPPAAYVHGWWHPCLAMPCHSPTNLPIPCGQNYDGYNSIMLHFQSIFVLLHLLWRREKDTVLLSWPLLVQTAISNLHHSQQHIFITKLDY